MEGRERKEREKREKREVSNLMRRGGKKLKTPKLFNLFSSHSLSFSLLLLPTIDARSSLASSGEIFPSPGGLFFTTDSG